MRGREERERGEGGRQGRGAIMRSRDISESRSSLVFVLLSAVVTCTILSHVMMNFHTLLILRVP